MADRPKSANTSSLKAPSAEHKQVAVASFNKAKESIAAEQYEYAVELLMTCCRLDPGNLIYRQTLRKTQKEKFGNNMRGSVLAFLTTRGARTRVKVAKRSGKYLQVLEHGEEVLRRNPWDLGTQMDMSGAFDALGLSDLAVFTLDQARQKHHADVTLNRALARLFEKRGDFQKAIALWQIVRDKYPNDVEASHKAKDLAASETIQKGQYYETASGSRESPALNRVEDAAKLKQEKLHREAEPIQKRIEADPTEPSLYVQLANLYRRYGMDDRARNALQQALGPTANDFRIRAELVELDLVPIRKNLDETESRVKILKAKAKSADKDDDHDGEEQTLEELTQLRVKLIREINQREIELFSLKADRFPNDLSHRLELGIRLLKGDKPEEAIAELQQARKDEKLKWKAAMNLGIAFKKRNNWRLAQRNFEDALAALPTAEEGGKKEILYQLASGAAETGELQRAVELGHELANLDYNFKGIGKLLDEWHERMQSA